MFLKKWVARILRAKEDQRINASEQRMYITDAIQNSISAPINSAACSIQALVTHLKTDKIPKFALFFTGLALFFNSVMLLLVYRQLLAYQDMNRIYQTQADIAQDTEQRELRAYINVTITNLYLATTPNDRNRVDFTVTNDGQTPAHNLSAVSILNIYEYPLRTILTILPNPKSYTSSKFYVPSHATIQESCQFNGPFSKDQVNAICKSDQRRLYFFTDVQYTDAFEKIRHLRFCVSFQGAAIQAIRDAAGNVPKAGPTIGEGTNETEPNNNYEY